MKEEKKYKEIVGGTQEDAEKKFPWLKHAFLRNAVIDITKDYLIWKGGTWEDGTWERGTWECGTWERGTWECGTWEDGIWERGIWKGGIWKGGVWEDGVWEGGVWEGGKMWSNIKQTYEDVVQEDGRLKVNG